MPRASGAVRDCRPAASAWSRMRRTALFSSDMTLPYGHSKSVTNAHRWLKIRARRLDHFAGPQGCNLLGTQSELGQHFLGVLTQQRGALHFGEAVAQLDRIAHGQIFAALGMVHFHNGAGGPQ